MSTLTLTGCSNRVAGTPRLNAAVQGSVSSAFASQERVRVFINLRDTLAEGAPAEERKSAIAAAQDRVLSALGATFVVTRRFATVAALAGELSRAGLDIAAAHPDVVSIQMDNAGSAARARSLHDRLQEIAVGGRR